MIRCRRCMICRCGVVWGRGRVVWGGGGVVRSWSRVIWLCLRVNRGPFISNFSNVSIVMVSSVLDMLSTTIRKSNRVRSAHSCAIRGFTSIESSLGVVISNCILIGVWLWGVLWLLVGCWVVGGRSWVVCGLVNHRGGLVNWGRVVWCRLVGWHWGVISWGRFVIRWGGLVVDRGGLVDRCWGMVWGRVVWCWGWVVGRLRMMIGSWCWMIWSRRRVVR